MRAVAALFVVLAACATPPAAADDLTPEVAVEITQACLAVRIGFGEKRESCIGEVSRVCGERLGEGAATTQGLVECAALESEAWRRLIDHHATALRTSQSATQNALLESALATGERWTRDRCAYDASLYEGGSLARVLAAQCVRDTLGMRAIDLDRRVHPDDEG